MPRIVAFFNGLWTLHKAICHEGKEENELVGAKALPSVDVITKSCNTLLVKGILRPSATEVHVTYERGANEMRDDERCTWIERSREITLRYHGWISGAGAKYWVLRSTAALIYLRLQAALAMMPTSLVCLSGVKDAAHSAGPHLEKWFSPGSF